MIYSGFQTILLAMVVLIVAQINTQINISEAANIITLNQDIEQRHKINLNSNTKSNKPQLNKEVYPNEQLILKPGESVKVYTKKFRGLVEGIQLSIKNLRTYSNGENIEQISINSFQEYPDKKQRHCSNILISKSTDYTITPINDQSKRRGHRTFIGCDIGMILELINVTDGGEATVILKYHRY